MLDPRSQSAIEYYFAEVVPEGAAPPEWPLDRLFAWLHAILHYVVREEQARAGFRREVRLASGPGHRDPAPDPLAALIRHERQRILTHCIPRLGRDYRAVIEMRMQGRPNSEIAGRLRVNPNTVATRLSRGIRTLARCIRHRAASSRGSSDA